MKQLIYSVAKFVIPYFIIFFISVAFYPLHKGDLLRLAYIPDLYPNYRKNLDKEITAPEKKYVTLSENPQNKSFKVLTIGDSFSEFGPLGYNNYIAQEASTLHIDRHFSKNPFQTLSEFVDDGFFDEYKIEYVVLESVEREIVERVLPTAPIEKTTLTEINKELNQKKTAVHGAKEEQKGPSHTFFSNQSLSFLLNAGAFLSGKKHIKNVYSYPMTNDQLFSNGSNRLLFYDDDYNALTANNNEGSIQLLNHALNTLSDKLSKKNIKLIVLIAPDKYDLYYNFIKDKNDLINPVFFSLMQKQEKKYIYIESKKILTEKINSGIKDIYYYDDTHWTPKANKIMADEILLRIKNNGQ
ncbi:alginate O-acetyltransferase AlgX-related protein [Chryseobacterium herbae]|uniref:AlgX/AlgJ SGNH hydrolase-like domain-containing protein n=1 Tax=Chryseobacterium herbae TaxID=2976476 RepID=A0ABT2IYZ4_9FLAO|nr:hypothetical protein [Chryseobacterium sp. pc1-10]MCT2564061.1 hypothetical protein [Chryseobacterium sp. pc1-10]